MEILPDGSVARTGTN
ncbi:hypothetical protein P4120_13170 [Bacillus thuringiensis]|nr:hypothetical protein [Bacillus thuringiensis]